MSAAPVRRDGGRISPPHLRLVGNSSCPSDVDALWESYRVAFNRWHQTKYEPDRIAALDRYNAWVVIALPPNEQAALFIGPHVVWGFN